MRAGGKKHSWVFLVKTQQNLQTIENKESKKAKKDEISVLGFRFGLLFLFNARVNVYGSYNLLRMRSTIWNDDS